MPAARTRKTSAPVTAGSGGTGKMVAVVGSDQGKVKEVAMRYAEELTPAGGGDFASEVIDGIAENAEAAARICRSAAGLNTVSLFGGDKLVWLKNANFFADSVTGRAQTTLDAVENLSDILKRGLPDGVNFLLTATEIDKRRTFYKLLEKAGTLVVHDLVDTRRAGWEAAIMGQIKQSARALSLQFEEDALELFVFLVGVDTMQINNELEKLSLYAGKNGVVTLEQVRSLVAKTREGIIFELGNAIGAKDLRRAVNLMEELLEQDESPVAILLAGIVPKVRNLLVARQLDELYKLPAHNYNAFEAALNRLDADETAFLPKKKEGGVSVYPLFLSLKEAGRFTAPHLMDGMKSCLQANKRLVTSDMDAKTVLEQLLVHLLGQ